jgi:hypothetical protein
MKSARLMRDFDYHKEVRVVGMQLDMYRDHGGYISTEVK